MRYRLYNTSLPTHGAGGYYALEVARDSQWGKGVRLSLGGYGWKRRWWRAHYTRYRGIAVHIGVGPITVSFLTGILG